MRDRFRPGAIAETPAAPDRIRDSVPLRRAAAARRGPRLACAGQASLTRMSQCMRLGSGSAARGDLDRTRTRAASPPVPGPSQSDPSPHTAGRRPTRMPQRLHRAACTRAARAHQRCRAVRLLLRSASSSPLAARRRGPPHARTTACSTPGRAGPPPGGQFCPSPPACNGFQVSDSMAAVFPPSPAADRDPVQALPVICPGPSVRAPRCRPPTFSE